MVDYDSLPAIMPKADPYKWVYCLNNAFARWGIDTAKRQAMFLAQVAVESMELTHMVEKLNYSAQRLLALFPSHFTDQSASRYAGNPELIANWIYANRMGNGDEDSGDGWRYRGRGLLQHTGHAEYIKRGHGIGIDLAGNPELLLTPEIACNAAGSYWQERDCNVGADVGDLYLVTRSINGGTNGIMDRQAYYLRACRILGVGNG